MTDDPIMQRITDAIGVLHAGNRDEARALFSAIWDEIEEDADPFHECTLAHFMADTQDDPAEELAWDLRALHAAGRVTQARAEAHHASLSIAGFFPSLHLNVADACLRLGDKAKARHHLEAGRALLGTLQPDGYGATIRRGLDRLDAALAE